MSVGRENILYRHNKVEISWSRSQNVFRFSNIVTYSITFLIQALYLNKNELLL